MSKTTILGIMLLMLATIALAASLSQDEIRQVNECKKNCTIDKKAELKTCQEESSVCVVMCNEVQGACIDVATQELHTCKQTCHVFFQINSSMNSSSKREMQKERYQCERSCQENFTKIKQTECNIQDCKQACLKFYEVTDFYF